MLPPARVVVGLQWVSCECDVFRQSQCHVSVSPPVWGSRWSTSVLAKGLTLDSWNCWVSCSVEVMLSELWHHQPMNRWVDPTLTILFWSSPSPLTFCMLCFHRWSWLCFPVFLFFFFFRGVILSYCCSSVILKPPLLFCSAPPPPPSPLWCQWAMQSLAAHSCRYFSTTILKTLLWICTHPSSKSTASPPSKFSLLLDLAALSHQSRRQRPCKM